MFVDEAEIEVRGGDGGNGAVAFRREKFVPRGGPNGGDGGRGGSIVLVADPQRTTLSDFRFKRKFVGPGGGQGGGGNCHGKDGVDVEVPVPVGTLVYAVREGADGVKSAAELIADMSEAGTRVVVAAGGRGGLGNQHFATATRQTPRFAQTGEPGERRTLSLQLKLLADAGIVGAPNAGKSTLLAAATAARPKIADYPFTTLEPQLGVVQMDVDASFVLVDLPGLIAGASRGAGLGDTFLRHIERTRALVHLVDGALPPDDALAQLRMIEAELAAWNPALAAKPRIVAVSKQDLPGAGDVLAAVAREIESASPGAPVVGISAATTAGVRELMGLVFNAIVKARADEKPPAVVLRPRPAAAPGVSVMRERDAFRVVGARLERLARMTNLDSDDGRAFFAAALARSGARKKLQRLGARPGDRILVGERELEYE